MLRFNFAIIFVLLGAANCLNLCGEWTQFKGNKCIKILDKNGSDSEPLKATEKEAQVKCNQLDIQSTIVTINDGNEQVLLSKLLSKYNDYSEYVWLGLNNITKNHNETILSDNKTKLNYTNWSDDVDNGKYECVSMSLGKSNIGKWVDEKCTKSAMVVCEKKMEIDFSSLSDTIQNLIDQVNSIIPKGFIYTQLPHQRSPHEMWPNMNWTDITEEYSGLFFRAEGNDSLAFGETQEADIPRISDIQANFLESKEFHYEKVNYKKVDLEEGGVKDIHPGGLLYQLMINTTAKEIKPRNTAVRIWRRFE